MAKSATAKRLDEVRGVLLDLAESARADNLDPTDCRMLLVMLDEDQREVSDAALGWLTERAKSAI